MGHAPAAELESALADTVNAWWRQHLFHGGPRRPHTTADARAVAASMASLPVRQRNDAAAHFAQSGFPTDLLPARVPERRVLECEWITEKVGDEARPVVLHAYDIGDDWNGWAEPLFTAEPLRAFMAAERRAMPEDEADPDDVARGTVYIIYEKKGEPGAFYMTADREAEAFEDRFAVLTPSAYTLPGGTALYDASGSGYTWSWA